MLLNTLQEIKNYLPINVAFHFEDIAPQIERATIKYLIPILSQKEYNILEKAYQDNTLSDVQKPLLHLCQRALANFAYQLWLPHGTIQVSQSGLHIHQDDMRRPPYKWQMDSLENAYEQTGYECLDEILLYLEQNANEFYFWRVSESYTIFQETLIATAAEFTKYIPKVDNSRRLFLLLKPDMIRVEESQLLATLCQAQYTHLKDTTQTLTEPEKNLLIFCKKAVAYQTFVEAIPDLLFEIYDQTLFGTAHQDETKQKNTPQNVILQNIQDKYARIAQQHWASLKTFINDNIAEFPKIQFSKCYHTGDTQPENKTSNKAFFL